MHEFKSIGMFVQSGGKLIERIGGYELQVSQCRISQGSRGGGHTPLPRCCGYCAGRGGVSPPRGFPLTPQRDFRVSIGGGFHGSFNPIPRPWESENYMVITTPEASRGGMCWVVLETLGYVGKVGAQDGVRGEFLRWNTPP